MAFLCSINFSNKQKPPSSDILFDDGHITVLSSEKDILFYRENNTIVVGKGKFWNKPILTTLLNLPNKVDLAQITLKGYQFKGREFFDQLDGSFSFCIINIPTKSVIGLRDHFGFQNLYYHHLSDSFLISDDIYEILKVTSPTINNNAIAKYFDFEENNKPYDSETFYQNIYKVLPAYYVSFEDKEIKQCAYWKPILQIYQDSPPSEQIEIFKKKLFNAIEKRSSFEENICTNLSGGLDSSSISCITKVLGYNTNAIYFSSGHTSTDERHFAQKAVNQYNFLLHEVSPPQDPLEAAKEFIRIYKMPDMLFMPVSSFFAIREKIKELDGHKILTGDGGDSVIGYGNEYLNELYEAEKWHLLNDAVSLYTKNRDLSSYFKDWLVADNQTRFKLYSTFFHGHYISKYLKKLALKKAFWAYIGANRYSKIKHLTFIKKGLRAFSNKGKNIFRKNLSIFTDSFIKKVSKSHNQYFDVECLSPNLTPFQKQHLAYNFTKLNLAVIEQQNAIMQNQSIEAIHPFYDKELIEISIAIPSKIRFDNGLGRGTLRKALKGILPEEIRVRTTKVEFSEYLLTSFENLWANVKNEISSTHKVWTYVQKSEFDKLIHQIFDTNISYKQKTKYVWLANRTINLALWLDFVDTLSAQHPNYSNS